MELGALSLTEGYGGHIIKAMNAFFSDVHVLWISRYTYQHEWSLTTHMHEDHYQIVYLLEGEALLCVGEEQVCSNGPLIMFIPPLTSHGIPCIYSSKLTTLDIKFTIQNRELIEACKQIPSLSKPRDGEVANLLKNIVKDGLFRKIAYQQMCSLQLGMVLLHLLRWNSNIDSNIEMDTFPAGKPYTSDNPLIKQMVQYLESNAMQCIDSSSLEHTFSQSYRHLSFLFSTEMGCTPLAYANKVRINAAKELLCNTDHPIKEICENLGFADIHQFSKSFKRVVGLPPASWRIQERGLICKDICIDPQFDNQNFLKKD